MWNLDAQVLVFRWDAYREFGSRMAGVALAAYKYKTGCGRQRRTFSAKNSSGASICILRLRTLLYRLNFLNRFGSRGCFLQNDLITYNRAQKYRVGGKPEGNRTRCQQYVIV
jgi:hypothetical protein